MKNSNSLHQLKDDGFVSISYPPELRAAVLETVKSWKNFCALPNNIKTQFPYNPNNGMGVGYELKTTPGLSHDLKEDLHVTTGMSDWLRQSAEQTGDPIITALISQAEYLINLMKPLVINFAKQVETEFSIKDFADEVENSQDAWFLRFLHFFGNRKAGDELATSHADKSGFTLHLYESDPGLQCLTMDLTWVNMPVSPGETVIIPGMRLQYRSGNILKALFHRVVATDATATAGRFSMVCFVHLSRTPEYDKKNAGRLQEFPPGFNYTMPFEEFKKLFVPVIEK